MNLAHLHIILNHFPTIGTVIGLALFALAFAIKNDDLKRFGLGLFLITGILVLPTFMSGEAAASIIRGREGVSEAYIQAHRSDAVVAFLFTVITAVFSWLALWNYRRKGTLAQRNMVTVLILSVITVGLMIYTGTAGGEISHMEIRPEGAVDPVGPGLAASIQEKILFEPWIWPAGEALHFLGMALLFGVVLLVNLRTLGFIKGIPYSALHRLLPWGMGAFAINLLTGMAFFIATPEQYIDNLSFLFKMALIILAGFNVIYFTVLEQPWKIGPDNNPPFPAKVMAVSTIAIWFGVIYFGRMLPYIGNSF